MTCHCYYLPGNLIEFCAFVSVRQLSCIFELSFLFSLNGVNSFLFMYQNCSLVFSFVSSWNEIYLLCRSNFWFSPDTMVAICWWTLSKRILLLISFLWDTNMATMFIVFHVYGIVWKPRIKSPRQINHFPLLVSYFMVLQNTEFSRAQRNWCTS